MIFKGTLIGLFVGCVMAAIAFTISSTIEEALATHMYGIGFALLFVISLLFALKKIRDSNK